MRRIQAIEGNKGTKFAFRRKGKAFHRLTMFNNGRFYTRDALPVWTSFGKNFVIRPVIRL